MYTLTDEAGSVVRTGRTNDLVRREAEHLRQYGDDLQFNVAHRVDDYATQRGLEQFMYNQNPTSWAANGGLTKIRPISVNNSKIIDHEKAAASFIYGPR